MPTRLVGELVAHLVDHGTIVRDRRLQDPVTVRAPVELQVSPAAEDDLRSGRRSPGDRMLRRARVAGAEDERRGDFIGPPVNQDRNGFLARHLPHHGLRTLQRGQRLRGRSRIRIIPPGRDMQLTRREGKRRRKELKHGGKTAQRHRFNAPFHHASTVVTFHLRRFHIPMGDKPCPVAARWCRADAWPKPFKCRRPVPRAGRKPARKPVAQEESPHIHPQGKGFFTGTCPLIGQGMGFRVGRDRTAQGSLRDRASRGRWRSFLGIPAAEHMLPY